MKRLKKKQILKIKNLAKSGLSLRKISKSLGIPKSTVYHHAKKYLRKMSKPDLNKLSDWERGYIVGLFAGDGCLNFIQRNYSYGIRFFFNRKEDQNIIHLLGTLIKKSGSKFHTVQKKRNTMELRVTAKKLFNFIKSHVAYKKGKERKSTRKKLVNPKIWNVKFKLGFIAGFIDSDGYVRMDKGKYIRCCISTTSKDMAFQTLSLLKELNINSSCHTDKRKVKRRNDLYIIRIFSLDFISNFNKIKSVKGRASGEMVSRRLRKSFEIVEG